jgi:NTE family protein
MRKPHPGLGLALGGGGILGVSHIGVLEVLEENGIFPELITGTSAGSLAAVFYACGIKAPAMRELALNLRQENLFAWNIGFISAIRLLIQNVGDLVSFLDLTPRGLINGERIKNYVNRLTGNKSLPEIRCGLGIVAADLLGGERVVFANRSCKGECTGIMVSDCTLGEAVQASIAVPGVFEPVRFRELLLADGGLVEDVPVPTARLLGARKVIAVSLGNKGSAPEPGSLVQVIMRSIGVMGLQETERALAAADVVIKPAPVAARLGDYRQIPALLASGRAAAEAALPLLEEIL